MLSLKYIFILAGLVLFHNSGCCQVDAVPVDPLLQAVENVGTDERWVQALTITSGEEQSLRWLSLSGGSLTAGSTFISPLVETEGNAGRFRFELTGFDTSAYLGNRMLRDHGHYPIHFQVDFADSHSVIITGKTLPFDDVSCYYSFDRAEYRLDFLFFERPPKPAISTGNNQSSTQHQNSGSTHVGSRVSSRETIGGNTLEVQAMLMDSIVIAASVLGIILLILGIILIIIRIKQKRFDGSRNFADVLDQKAENDDQTPAVEKPSPVIKTPEMQEASIRELMQSDNISYDEAALRIQYQAMNPDNG